MKVRVQAAELTEGDTYLSHDGEIFTVTKVWEREGYVRVRLETLDRRQVFIDEFPPSAFVSVER